jgi:hypothetical protein
VNAGATGYSRLNRVDATSTSNVWAIGSLVERCNGSEAMG